MNVRHSVFWTGLLAASVLGSAAIAQEDVRPDRRPEQPVLSSQDVTELLGTNSARAKRMALLLEEHDRSLRDLIETAEEEADGHAVAARLRFMDQTGVRGPERKADGDDIRRRNAEQLVALVACIDDQQRIRIVTVDVASGEVVHIREMSPGAAEDDERHISREQQQVRVIKGTDFIGSDVANSQGDDLGDVSDLALDPATGEIRYAVLSFGGWLGMGDKLFAIPYGAFKHSKDKLLLDIDKEKLKTAPGFDKDNWPNMADRRWSEELERFYSIGRASHSDTSTALRIVKADDIIGADVHNLQDEDLGDIEDLVIDPGEGRVRYAVLAHGGIAGLGEKLFAIPWSALDYGEDDKIIIDITEERLEEAPGFDDEHWPNLGDPEWADEVHRYYGQEN